MEKVHELFADAEGYQVFKNYTIKQPPVEYNPNLSIGWISMFPFILTDTPSVPTRMLRNLPTLFDPCNEKVVVILCIQAFLEFHSVILNKHISFELALKMSKN
uniref:Uncharacterized protein n=1 Tax=Glossina pallidipes TaxID=7398 RepID=A0A1B0AG90_GLOPL